MTTPNNIKASPERVRALVEDEHVDPRDYATLALHLKMNPDAARRAMQRLGYVEVQEVNVVSAAQLERLRELGAEGMIAPFIAEELGVSTSTVGKKLGPRPEAALEWRRAWQSIRKDPRMLELHREIAPSQGLHQQNRSTK